ncbi:MAG: hypothetical protein U0736_26675 [Gemmataceae bacterium]
MPHRPRPVANAATAGTAPGAATESADPGLSVPAPARTPTRTPEFTASEADDADAEDVDAPAKATRRKRTRAADRGGAGHAAVGGLSTNTWRLLQQGWSEHSRRTSMTSRRSRLATTPGLDTPWATPPT